MDNRVTGMASGMDIDSQVQQLMQAEREPLNKMQQDQYKLQYEMEDYREVNREMQSFSDSIFDGIIRRSNMGAKEATSSNESLVDVSASADANEGSTTISEVERLATSARNTSQLDADGNGVQNADGENLSATEALIDELGSGDDVWETRSESESLSLTEGSPGVQLKHGGLSGMEGETITLETESGTETLDVVTNEDDLEEGKVYVNETEGIMEFNEPLEEAADIELDYDYNEFEFDIGTFNEDGEEVTETFTFDGSSALNDVMDEINGSEIGVNAFYDEFSGQMSMTRSETGEFNEDGDEMTFNGGFLTDVMKMDQSEEQDGENAKFTMNGIDTERRSNTFTDGGVEYTLKDTFKDTSVQTNVNADTDSIVETVTDFVDEYNDLIEKVDGKLTEEVHRDYPPLTDEQREEMSETEQEQWDERAKSGMIARDSMLSGALDTMRQDMYGEVDTGEGAAFSQLTEIGITTTSNYQDRGKLEVDEDKLRASVEEDPDAVYQLFSGDGDSYEGKGLARRARDTLDTTIDQISERAGGPLTVSPDQFTIGREMTDLDEEMSDFERRLAQTEERYWNQFTEMEQAMQEANNQQQQMMSQMGGGGGTGGMM